MVSNDRRALDTAYISSFAKSCRLILSHVRIQTKINFSVKTETTQNTGLEIMTDKTVLAFRNRFYYYFLMMYGIVFLLHCIVCLCYRNRKLFCEACRCIHFWLSQPTLPLSKTCYFLQPYKVLFPEIWLRTLITERN